MIESCGRACTKLIGRSPRSTAYGLRKATVQREHQVTGSEKSPCNANTGLRAPKSHRATRTPAYGLRKVTVQREHRLTGPEKSPCNANTGLRAPKSHRATRTPGYGIRKVPCLVICSLRAFRAYKKTPCQMAESNFLINLHIKIYLLNPLQADFPRRRSRIHRNGR
jgi:hypothetical protein